MAFCSPALMATSLPKVVPKLLNVMAEPKKELSTAADKAVHNIGSVITNPEIVPLVPLLHTALQVCLRVFSSVCVCKCSCATITFKAHADGTLNVPETLAMGNTWWKIQF
jgi:hypothetical protein